MLSMWNDRGLDPDGQPVRARRQAAHLAGLARRHRPIWFTDQRLTGRFEFAGGPSVRIDPTGQWLYILDHDLGGVPA